MVFGQLKLEHIDGWYVICDIALLDGFSSILTCVCCLAQAPEVIRHESYSETADVFSFGAVLWQLTTRELPYENKSTFEAAAAVAMESVRPPFPDGIPSTYQQLVEECWQDDPDKRPQFEEIVDALSEMEKNLTEEEISWFEAPLGHPAYRKVVERKSKEDPPQLNVPVKKEKDENAAANKKGKPQKPGRIKKLFGRKSSYF